MIVRVLRVLLAFIFIIFGGLKLLDVSSFVENVANFQISPFNQAPYDMWLAYFLPPLELVVGVCLLIGFWMRGSLLISAGMVLAFMAAIGSVWMRGLNIDCGCAGGTVSMGGYPTHLMVLSAMLGIITYLILDTLFPAVDRQS